MMRFTIDLDYTPRSPQPGSPFTEARFVRKSRPFTFDVQDVGVALVDLWNFGWEDVQRPPMRWPKHSQGSGEPGPRLFVSRGTGATRSRRSGWGMPCEAPGRSGLWGAA